MLILYIATGIGCTTYAARSTDSTGWRKAVLCGVVIAGYALMGMALSPGGGGIK